jgi:hypothetical protein
MRIVAFNIQMLVVCRNTTAIPLVAGTSLESLLPRAGRKLPYGTWLIAVPYGNNVKNWIIRRREPKCVMVSIRFRFNDR